MCRGSDGLANTCLGAIPAPVVKTADNFCAQARYFVHVTFATLQRKHSVTPLLQKNTMVSAQNPSKTDLAHQLPPESWEMPSGSLLAAPGELPESLLGVS